MKKAIAILNRNMPELTDDLVESLSSIDADIFVLENGSEKEKYSKYANLFETESKGLAYGVNRLFNHCMDLGYDYVWMNYNDARAEDPSGFFNWSIEQMEKDNRIGVSVIHWGSMWDINGRKCPTGWWDSGAEDMKRSLVSFFDDLSFVVSRRALDTIYKSDPRLTPFFDTSNYTNHYSVLAPSLALYSSEMFMITNPKFSGIEIRDPAESNSELARGFDDSYWKHTKGPEDMKAWMNKFFPEMSDMKISTKEKRNIVIRKICEIYHGINR